MKKYILLSLIFLTSLTQAFGYDRKEYGGWQRDRETGCNTRQNILMTQYKEFKEKVGKCQIEGVWIDFFTGKELHDVKKIDIDHVLSVSEYESKCRRGADRDKIRKFYNDRDNLVITDKKVNQRKGNKSKDEYASEIKDLKRREAYIKKYDMIWDRYCR